MVWKSIYYLSNKTGKSTVCVCLLNTIQKYNKICGFGVYKTDTWDFKEKIEPIENNNIALFCW